MTMLAGIITTGAVAFFFGVCLAIAFKKLAVSKDPRVEAVTALLPGINCGACGFPGCAGYAEAIVLQNAPVNKCAPGGAAVAKALAAKLGLSTPVVADRTVAVLTCQGGKGVAAELRYAGVPTCVAAALIGGTKRCAFGCIGLGDCAKVCPVDAITMGANGLPDIDEARCIGCGACVRECPRRVLVLVPDSQRVYLGCASPDKGMEVKNACSRGCIACGLCATPKVTPSGVIKLAHNLPQVPPDWQDYETAVAKCPAQSFMVRKKPAAQTA